MMCGLFSAPFATFGNPTVRSMDFILHIIEHHGYLALFVIVFLEAIGLPIPAAIALVVAGAASALHVLSPGWTLLVSVIGILSGDVLLFQLGRKSGWGLLGLLCRVAVNPETCILRSAESFYKRGRMTLLFAKFIPGINTMAPPLAGSMRMRFRQFIRLDLGGALLYTLAYAGAGFIFSHLLKDMMRLFATLGRAMEFITTVAVLVYIAYRFYLYWTHRIYRVVPRVQIEELIERQRAGENFIVADVRSHGYYDGGALRIKGSIRLEPNNLHDSMVSLPKDKLIFLYCT